MSIETHLNPKALLFLKLTKTREEIEELNNFHIYMGDMIEHFFKDHVDKRSDKTFNPGAINSVRCAILGSILHKY